MTERFGSDYPRARIAEAAETFAGKRFGPEGLPKADIARSLNLREEDISPEEWSDIYEFSVNAGAELAQTAIAQEIPEDPSKKEVRSLRKRLRENKINLSPFHDLFHAADRYRATGGREAAASFAHQNARERYVDSDVAGEEFYPLLFLASNALIAPLPVLLSTLQGRIAVLDFFHGLNLPRDRDENIRRILMEEPETPEAKRAQYERLVEQAIIGNAERSIGPLTEEEVREMEVGFREFTAHPSAHYAEFADRVFREEWRENPRLFLDEFLEDVRTFPERPTGTSTGFEELKINDR